MDIVNINSRAITRLTVVRVRKLGESTKSVDAGGGEQNQELSLFSGGEMREICKKDQERVAPWKPSKFFSKEKKVTIISKASEGCPVDLTMWSHWQLGKRVFVIQWRLFPKK